jgi:hypothetical protein
MTRILHHKEAASNPGRFNQVAQAVIGCWQNGEVTGLRVDDLGFEEARSLIRPAMTYVRGQRRGRLTARLGRVHRSWLHPISGR